MGDDKSYLRLRSSKGALRQCGYVHEPRISDANVRYSICTWVGADHCAALPSSHTKIPIISRKAANYGVKAS